MPRKGENIYKRKDGRWEGRYMKDRISGKAYYGYIYGKTYKEVKQRLIQIKDVNTFKSVKEMPQKKDIAFADVAEDWLEHSASFLKDSSIAKYRNFVYVYLIPAFGKCQMDEITNEMVYALVYGLLNNGGRKQNGLSPKTVSDCISVLKGIQKYAMDRNMDVNITISDFPIKKGTKPLRVFTLQEQQKLCHYLKEHKNLSNLGILVCLFTGIRIGELCALKWKDVSLKEKTIYIHQTMQRLQVKEMNGSKTRVIISAPKSDCSIRMVPIPDVILEDISSMQKPSDTYFLTGDNLRYIEPRTMQNRFQTVLKSCGMECVNFHVLRHTFATRCVEVGFDVKSLSEILGHSNVNITLNRYVHPSLEAKHENMSKLSDLFAVK